jgi:hypothetical protein
MRMAGALFHVMDVARDVLVIVMMADPVEPHLIVAARTDDPVAVDDPADALVKRRAAFRATYPDFQVIDGIVHRLGLRFQACQGVVDGALRRIVPAFRATMSIRICTGQAAVESGGLNDFVSKNFNAP